MRVRLREPNIDVLVRVRIATEHNHALAAVVRVLRLVHGTRCGYIAHDGTLHTMRLQAPKLHVYVCSALVTIALALTLTPTLPLPLALPLTLTSMVVLIFSTACR